MSGNEFKVQKEGKKPFRSKKYAEVDFYRCVSCGACTKVCPKSAILIDRGCYAVVEAEICVGCGKCKNTCPADCITLKERADR